MNFLRFSATLRALGKIWFGGLLCAFSSSALSDPASSTVPGISDFLLEETYEIALARSAAPPAVSSKATVLVLRTEGYEAVIEGTNGITCYVVRSWGAPRYWDRSDLLYRPDYRVAECLDPHAAKIILPLQFFRTGLAIEKTPPEDLNRQTIAAFEQGKLKRADRAAFSYMLSNANQFQEGRSGPPPHIMVYLPDDYRPETAGSPNQNDGFFIGGGAHSPYTAALIFRPGYDPYVDNQIEP